MKFTRMHLWSMKAYCIPEEYLAHGEEAACCLIWLHIYRARWCRYSSIWLDMKAPAWHRLQRRRVIHLNMAGVSTFLDRAISLSTMIWHHDEMFASAMSENKCQNWYISQHCSKVIISLLVIHSNHEARRGNCWAWLPHHSCLRHSRISLSENSTLREHRQRCLADRALIEMIDIPRWWSYKAWWLSQSWSRIDQLASSNYLLLQFVHLLNVK